MSETGTLEVPLLPVPPLLPAFTSLPPPFSLLNLRRVPQGWTRTDIPPRSTTRTGMTPGHRLPPSLPTVRDAPPLPRGREYKSRKLARRTRDSYPPTATDRPDSGSSYRVKGSSFTYPTVQSRLSCVRDDNRMFFGPVGGCREVH